jgi:hypothetical protein
MVMGDPAVTRAFYLTPHHNSVALKPRQPLSKAKNTSIILPVQYLNPFFIFLGLLPMLFTKLKMTDSAQANKLMCIFRADSPPSPWMKH